MHSARHPGGTAPSPSSQASQRLWGRFFHRLKRQWWVPLLTLVVGAGAGAAWFFTRPQLYVSYASMGLQGRVNLTERSLYRDDSQNFLGTHIHLLRSPAVVARAHERVLEARKSLAGQRSSVDLTAIQLRNTSIIQLQAVGPDPGYLPPFLDAVMDEYLALRRSQRQSDSEDAAASLNALLTKYESQLQAAREKRDNFMTNNAFLTTNTVVDLERDLQRARAELEGKDRQLDDLALEEQMLDLGLGRGAVTNAVGAVSPAVSPTDSDPGVVRELTPILTQLRVLQAQRDKLARTHRPEHPKMKRLADDIARYESTAQTLRDQGAEQLKARRESIRLRQRTLEEAKRELEPRVRELGRIHGQYLSFVADVEAAQKMADTLKEQVNRLDLSRNLERESLSKMSAATDAAAVERSYVKAQMPVWFLALSLGLGILYLLARYDDRVLGAHELTELLAEPVIGQIPRIETSPKGGSLELLNPDDTRFTLAESFRGLRSSLMFGTGDKAPPRTLLVTSSISGEGKSMVAVNLAQTLAWSGAEVLLIDADMRRGRLHRHFQLPGAPGLGELLSQGGDWQHLVVATSQPGLLLLPCGESELSPGELLLRDRLPACLEEFSEHFQYVILDSPPVLAADDVTSLAPRVGGVIFVLRSSFTAVRIARQALAELRRRGARILGLVVNAADSTASDYFGYSYAEYYSQKSKGADSSGSGSKVVALPEADPAAPTASPTGKRKGWFGRHKSDSQGTVPIIRNQ